MAECKLTISSVLLITFGFPSQSYNCSGFYPRTAERGCITFTKILIRSFGTCLWGAVQVITSTLVFTTLTGRLLEIPSVLLVPLARSQFFVVRTTHFEFGSFCVHLFVVKLMVLSRWLMRCTFASARGCSFVIFQVRFRVSTKGGASVSTVSISLGQILTSSWFRTR